MYKKHKKNFVTSILLILIVMVSLGYALVSRELDISGSSKIKSTRWNIHFENVQVKSGSVEILEANQDQEARIDPEDVTKVSFKVTLDKPGDYYEFTVDAVNSGAIDGVVDTVVSKLNDEVITTLPSYLSYTVTYDNGNPIQKDQVLRVNERQKYKVKVEYKKDIENSELVEDDISLSFDFTVNYKQGDGGTPVPDQVNYQVLHKYQNLDLETYSEESETLQGEAGSSVTPSLREREGFNNPEEQTVTISSEGDTVVTYTYTRKSYHFSITDRTYVDNTSTSDGDYPYETVITVKAIERANYSFHWSDNNTDYERSITLTSNLELTPIYSQSAYTITLNPNGGELDNTTRVVEEGQAIGELPIPEYTGYYLEGWYSELTGGIEIDSSYIPTADKEIFARWKVSIEQATISNSDISLHVGEEETITITNASSIEEEYTFTSNDETIATVDNTGKVTGVAVGETTVTITGSSSGKTKTVNVEVLETLPNTYRITFNPGEGSVTEVEREVNAGEAIGTLPVPTRTNYLFKGWHLTSSEGELVDDSFIPEADTTLYAKWVEDPFPKVFEQAGECTFNGSSSNITGEECSNYTNQKYIDTGISLYSSENINKDYEIHFEIESYNPSNQVKQATFVNTKNEASGYPGLVFRRSEETDILQLASRKTSGANESYEVDYNGITSVSIYRIRNTETNIQEIYYSINGADKVLLNDLTQYNPTFNLTTWFGAAPSNAAGTSAQRYLVGTLKNMYVRLGTYPEVPKYTITLNANGGNVTPASIKVTEGQAIGTLPTPTKTESYFIGWYTLPEDGIEVTSSYIPSSDMEIYARWRNLEYYEVTFDKNNNDAVGTMANQRLLEGTLATLTENAYSLEGYGFVGWNTEPDGSGTSYLDEADITLTTDLTLYAQWARIYTLSFDKNNNDATGNSYSITVVSGVSTSIPSEAFSAYRLSKKAIDYYNSELDYTGSSYYQGQGITITSDTTLYAHWDVPHVTDTIYWALQDNDSDNKNETLIISSNQVSGNQSGSFAGDTQFTNYNSVPWIVDSYNASSNLSYNVTTVNIEGIVVPKYTRNWFNGVGNNASSFTANFDNLITSQVIDMSYMFYLAGRNATTFDIGDISGWDTSKVTDMIYMFSEAGYNATTWSMGDLSGWNTSNVTNMSSMFYRAGNSATTFELDLSGWDTSKVTDMSSMFSDAGLMSSHWRIGDLSDWNTSQVINMDSMFASAGGWKDTTFNISYIGDLGRWDTSNVENMCGMFFQAGSKATTFELDLSGWDTSKVTNMSDMFYAAGRDATTFNLDLSGWDTSNVTNMGGMFTVTGRDATTWLLTIPQTNGGGISNTTSKLYGSTTSTYVSSPSGRQFTLVSN